MYSSSAFRALLMAISISFNAISVSLLFFMLHHTKEVKRQIIATCTEKPNQKTMGSGQ
jgi:hypothetical protein